MKDTVIFICQLAVMIAIGLLVSPDLSWNKFIILLLLIFTYRAFNHIEDTGSLK